MSDGTRSKEGSGAEGAPGVDSACFQLMNEIGIIGQLASRLFERVMPPDLTLPQFGVLNHFVRLDRPSTAIRLASAFQVTKGAMANTLGHLERKGYVAIAPHPRDGRAKRVTITPAGRAARERAVAALGPSIAGLAEAVSPRDVEAALPTLARIRAHLDAERDEEPF